jgi:hypothetical protein
MANGQNAAKIVRIEIGLFRPEWCPSFLIEKKNASGSHASPSKASQPVNRSLKK